MISKPIPYGRQHITDEDIRAVIDTLKSDYLTQGPRIREFETKFAGYVGAQYAVAVNNATSGLHLAATALNVKPGDKVIVTIIFMSFKWPTAWPFIIICTRTMSMRRFIMLRFI